MARKFWVVTRAVNDYNQDGDYLVGVFGKKPAFQDLKKLLPNESDVTLGKLTRGGGRQDVEDVWFLLSELEEFQEYQEKQY